MTSRPTHHLLYAVVAIAFLQVLGIIGVLAVTDADEGALMVPVLFGSLGPLVGQVLVLQRTGQVATDVAALEDTIVRIVGDALDERLGPPTIHTVRPLRAERRGGANADSGHRRRTVDGRG